MTSGSSHAAETGAELMKAMTRLRARLRTESAPDETPTWTWSQLMTLARIVKEGPTTVSELAQAEHVRRQSMAETVSSLRAQGLISSVQDLGDRRRTLISPTERGRSLSRTIPAAREEWLSRAISRTLSSGEQQTLRQATAIINRLADSMP
jgi:DNA-binding MarR family transcriptional regulator